MASQRPVTAKEWMTPEGIATIEEWARDEGLVNREIAERIGVTRTTFQEWLRKYPDLKHALSRGKQYTDRKIERSAFQTATGYSVTHTKKYRDADGNITSVIEETKWVPGDVAAQKFLLKNRRPDKWRDKQETEISGAIDMGKQSEVVDKYFQSLGADFKDDVDG